MLYERKAYYHETDQMGVVHHANYFKWLEEARIYFLDKIGLNYNDLEKRGIISPVVSISAKYIKPVLFDDVVLIDLKVTKYTGVRFEIEYDVIDKKTNEIRAKAKSEHCLIKNGQILRIKNDEPKIDDIFKKYIESNK